MRKSEAPVFDFRLADGSALPCLFEFSARAKRVLLKYSPDRGLRMAWPEARMPEVGEIPAILEQFRPWIEKQAARAQKRAEGNGAGERGGSGGFCGRNGEKGKDILPDSINLAAVGEVWPVVYEIVESDKMTLEVRKVRPEIAGKTFVNNERPQNEPGRATPERRGKPVARQGFLPGICVPEPRATVPDSCAAEPKFDPAGPGPAKDHLAVFGSDPQYFPQILQKWLLNVAKSHLTGEAMRLAAQYGFKINNVTVKRQKTCWGSCSGKSNVNLNYRLMLLRPELVRLVIMHEFCHLKHMNHGEGFYRLLASYCPNWKELDEELRRAEREFPAWSTVS